MRRCITDYRPSERRKDAALPKATERNHEKPFWLKAHGLEQEALWHPEQGADLTSLLSG